MQSTADPPVPIERRDEPIRALPAVGVSDRVAPGSIIDILGSRHRIVALVKKRMLASDLRTHHPYLIQDSDGSIQLPKISAILGMIERGQAVPVNRPGLRPRIA